MLHTAQCAAVAPFPFLASHVHSRRHAHLLAVIFHNEGTACRWRLGGGGGVGNGVNFGGVSGREIGSFRAAALVTVWGQLWHHSTHARSPVRMLYIRSMLLRLVDSSAIPSLVTVGAPNLTRLHNG